MSKYEIMMIVDPKADVKVAFDLLSEVFGKGVQKAEKLENNRLAYKIKKSEFGQYVLANVETEGSNISEFTRRTNIIKEVWRSLVINLDSEKGLSSKKASKKPVRAKRVFERKPRENSTENSEKQTRAPRAPRAKKVVEE
ncbi:30S ribosomal protein S6 [Mycoplasmopsis canis PG 14]|uniref:Small ribosomal subunit protein bS6 n=1 Tax=Mycoplasmopsis canis TaxID=29555 RepID=A0A449AQ80_9BACT|nr:30S ribosomal protein S6 [Mycoplasmopsis canis]AMD81302.1 30S ribosomal protein S6 [Mycoplasmopsis canis PG 14]EIE40555.1 30S ribosomal protein S6 [Mycoplasmopsis canis PG 14]VEU68724.1 30S ribosomal protein S6 [Mycoplasmopsis canis]